MLGAYDGISPLQKLNISRNNIRANGIGQLFVALRSNAMLSNLIIDHNPLGNNVPYFLTLFTDNSTLRYLSMQHCDLDCEGVACFNDGLALNRGIYGINMSFNNIGSAGAKAIGFGILRNIGKLEEMDLTGNKIDNKGGTALAYAISKNKRIKKFSIRHNHL